MEQAISRILYNQLIQFPSAIVDYDPTLAYGSRALLSLQLPCRRFGGHGTTSSTRRLA